QKAPVSAVRGMAWPGPWRPLGVCHAATTWKRLPASRRSSAPPSGGTLARTGGSPRNPSTKRSSERLKATLRTILHLPDLPDLMVQQHIKPDQGCQAEGERAGREGSATAAQRVPSAPRAVATKKVRLGRTVQRAPPIVAAPATAKPRIA